MRLLDVFHPHAYRYTKERYSAFGEDSVLIAFFPPGYRGFYVDIGSYHPYKESNTYYFYRRGWRGINVEPSIDGIRRFQKHRKRDINVNKAIGSFEGKTTYYAVSGRDSKRINTTSHERAQSLEDSGKSLTMRDVQCSPLSTLFEEYLPKGQRIDLLDVDCEFDDLEILQSNDWDRYRPSILLVEDQEMKLNSSIDRYCQSVGYELASWCRLTKIFRRLTAC